MLYRLLLLWPFIFLMTLHTRAQDDFSKVYTKNFTVNSPNAYSFSKIANVKMSPFTGMANISLPLYEKKMSVLDLSLNMVYTGGGGIKTITPGTTVGRAWLLSAGGMISRNKRGVPDDYFNTQTYNASVPTRYNGILYNGGITYRPDGEDRVALADNAYYYAEGTGDSQHDIFEFNVLGKSGRFYIGKDQQVQIVTDSKMKVIPNFTNSSLPEFKLGSFLLIDEAGIKYYFDQVEIGISYEINPGNRALYFGKQYAASWLLTKIEAPFNEETIQYDYARGLGSRGYGGAGGGYTKRSDQPNGGTFGGGAPASDELRVKSITFSDGVKINFKYFQRYADGTDEFPLLRTMEVLNSRQETMKEYVFNYLEWASGNKQTHTNAFEATEPVYNARERYFLNSISQVGDDAKAQALYAFEYYQGPDYNEEYLYANDRAGYDLWGFYNGKPKGTGLTIATQYGPAADRSSDLTWAQLGSLKKIIYPTGGSEEFTYELNDKRTGSANTRIGGVRIKASVLYDGINTQTNIVKQYRYIETDGLSSGFLGEKPEFNYVTNVYYDDGGWPSNPNVKYTVATSFIDPANPLSTVEGSFVGYRRVEELWQNGSQSNGKIIYEFSDLNYTSLWLQSDYFPYRPVDRPYWAVGLPVRTIYMSNTDTVKQIVNEYNLVQQKLINDNFRSLHVEKKGEVDMFNSNSTTLRYIYKFANYYPVIGRKELTAVHEYTYPSNTTLSGAVHRVTRNTYDPDHYTLRTSSEETSKNDLIKKYYYYPYDYNLGTTSFTTKLVEKNMLNQPVNMETWLITAGAAAYLTSAEVVEHKILANNQIRPFKLHTSRLLQPLAGTPGSFSNTVLLPATRNFQPLMTFTVYDNVGRLVEFEKEGSNRTAIILDKIGNVLAKADNASFGNIAYSGFESDETGNWSYTSSGVTATTTKFGTRAYKGTITKGSLPTGNYTLTLLAKGSGSVTVNGVSKAITASWAAYSWPLTGISAITINSNNNLLDEVALCPQDAQLAVYNYKKDMDAAAATDPAGKTTYYEYDNLNRLQYVRNHQETFDKTYEYQFKPVFSNTSQSGSYTRSNVCPVNQVPGPPVTYTVPAAKYTSIISQQDADAQALSDVHLHGQRYADDNGACIPIYYNDAYSKPFTITCPTGTVPNPPYYYYVEEKKYSSTISKEAANALAQQEADTYGPGEAALRISCVQMLTVSVYNSTPENVRVYFSGGVSSDYTVPPGTTNVSIPEGTYSVYMTTEAGNTRYRFYVGSRTAVEGTSATFGNVNITNGTGSERNMGVLRIFN